MIGFVSAIALFGFIVAIPLFVLSYMRNHGANWQKSFLISVLTLIVIYALFSAVLEVTLHPGLLPEIFFT
jgi:hypothetical protein